MKTIILLSLLAFTCSVYAQTDVISVKSHSGSVSEIVNAPDNFGIPSPRLVSITYIGHDCIVHAYDDYFGNNHLRRDTICNDPFMAEYDYDVEKLKPMYGESVEFSGFELRDTEKKEVKNSSRRQSKKSSTMWWMLILAGGSLVYATSKKRS